MEKGVMIVAAHPDDAEIAMGGTIASFTKAGIPTVIVDLTNGEPTPFGSVEKRALETRDASAILGVTQRLCLNLPNREVFDSIENRNKLAATIRVFKPEVLFMHYSDDGHPDHIAAERLTVAARFYAKLSKSQIPGEPWYPRKMLSFFSTHIRPRFQPSFVFDISPHIQTKIDALLAYKSQFVDNPKNVGVSELLKVEAAYWGAQVGCKYGEAFSSKENIKISDPLALLDV